MPRESYLIGVVKLRQAYNRQGYNYYSIGVPPAVVRFLEWQPGRLLTYYPTKDGGLKLRMQTTESVAEASVDLDPRAVKGPEPERGVRPGSYAARAQEVDSELQEIMRTLREEGPEASIRKMSELSARKAAIELGQDPDRPAPPNPDAPPVGSKAWKKLQALGLGKGPRPRNARGLTALEELEEDDREKERARQGRQGAKKRAKR